MQPFHTLAAEGIEVTLDLRVGHVRGLTIMHNGHRMTPLHTAPWVDDEAITSDPSLPGNLRYLSGDFFCAPFSTSDIEEAPPHGWPANSPWLHVGTVREGDAVTASYRLERRVMGATVEKRFTVRDGHPFLYETHVLSGGSGSLPVANHAMTRLPGGGRLAFSAKDAIETPNTPLEPDPARGRSRLAYPARVADPARVPLADGSVADITRYPFAERHDDFVMLVEKPGSRLGWIAVSRPDRGDALISLKNPNDYPVTFLWFSNGGRDYSPWNGRHLAVLGVEEARAYSVHGHRAAIEPNALSDAGIPTALTLVPGGQVAVRNVVGALPLGAMGSPIAGVEPRDGRLELHREDGTRFDVPFASDFLAGA